MFSIAQDFGKDYGDDRQRAGLEDRQEGRRRYRHDNHLEIID
jgi:hypothetical protein